MRALYIFTWQPREGGKAWLCVEAASKDFVQHQQHHLIIRVYMSASNYYSALVQNTFVHCFAQSLIYFYTYIFPVYYFYTFIFPMYSRLDAKQHLEFDCV